MSNKILYLFYFLSGFSALIYEVVWLRKLELVFGTTTYAVSTVLAVFFTGLAVGSWVFGKFMNPQILTNHGNTNMNESISSNSFQISLNSRPILLYGLLELGIGFYAALTPWIFKLIEGVQASFWQSFEPSFAGFSVFTFVLSGIGLLLPTILMGGTFPTIAAAISRIKTNEKRMGTNDISSDSLRIGSNSHAIGLLYGLNTLGAVLGVLAAGFFLIASIGVNQTIWLAAGISMAVGLAALWLSDYFFFLCIKVGRAIRNKTSP